MESASPFSSGSRLRWPSSISSCQPLAEWSYLLAVGLTCFKYFSMKSEITDTLDKEMAGNPFGGFARMAVEGMRLDFGVAILIIGGCVLVGAAFIPDKREN